MTREFCLCSGEGGFLLLSCRRGEMISAYSGIADVKTTRSLANSMVLGKGGLPYLHGIIHYLLEEFSYQ